MTRHYGKHYLTDERRKLAGLTVEQFTERQNI